MGNTFYFPFEPALILWLQNTLGELGTALSSVFTFFGEEIVLFAIAGTIYWSVNKKTGIWVIRYLLFGLTASCMLKNAVLRRRPYFDHKDIVCQKPVDGEAGLFDINAQGYSFPSAHSTNSVTVYTSLGFISKKKLLTFFGLLVPLLVGFSRVCLGVHYPTDVLAGWMIGGLSVLILDLCERSRAKKAAVYAVTAFAALSGYFFCRSSDYFSSLGLLLGLLAGDLFEERFVRFENTKNITGIIARTVGGMCLFLILNFLFKLPFSDAFQSSEGLLPHIVRTARYALTVFLLIGVYPASFQFFRKR